MLDYLEIRRLAAVRTAPDAKLALRLLVRAWELSGLMLHPPKQPALPKQPDAQ